jgi:hypothetical protein
LTARAWLAPHAENRRRLEEEDLQIEEPNWIRVDIRWKTITASDTTDWPFRQNGSLGSILQDATRKGPQIYRFLFHDRPVPSCYIGESERFEGRVQAYQRTLRLMRNGVPAAQATVESLERAIKRLNSDSKTRVGAALQNAEVDGSKVDLQLLNFSEFVFNKVEISSSSLTDPFHRKAMENLAILDARISGLNVLNRGRDSNAKWFGNQLRHGAKSYTPDVEG